ncbi:MAG: glycosyl transferase [Deltaproteobacteria bacterium HGW-Deltaproteobacteria-4]|nr:MAG: glycosyl transferase [Deltaproteobacteria bacterium HGW-Deltaproteobacteria-4]
MSVEILSGRILAPYFGGSIHVWGAIITIFMLALAIGYLIGGRLSVNQPSIQKLSFILLAAAVLTTPIVLLDPYALDAIFSVVQDPRYGSLASATTLFFLPTVITGIISPYAVRLLVNECRFSGRYAGLLYFVSTLGSATGALMTAFYLVLYLETNQIVWILISISMMLGLFSLLFTRSCVQN